MTTPTDPGAVVPLPSPTQSSITPVLRGLIGVALERTDPAGDGALALCEAWEAMDLDPDQGFEEPRVSAAVSGGSLVAAARRFVRQAAVVAEDATLAALVEVADHLERAERLLEAETTCDGDL